MFRVMLLGALLATLGCGGSPSLENCEIVVDTGIVGGIDEALDQVHKKMESDHPTSTARSMFWKDFTLEYYDCGAYYAVDAHFMPVVEPGVDKFGDNQLFILEKNDYEIRSIFLGEEKYKVPEKVLRELR